MICSRDHGADQFDNNVDVYKRQPFGHAGEYVLNEICEDGFRHNEQSVRIVEKLEKNGMGLNLSLIHI